jgi:hypothetical protein
VLFLLGANHIPRKQYETGQTALPSIRGLLLSVLRTKRKRQTDIEGMIFLAKAARLKTSKRVSKI